MKLGIAAVSNALSIAEEASLLYDEGHQARAHSLSVLAAEESSKAWAALLAGLYPDDAEIGQALRQILRGHH